MCVYAGEVGRVRGPVCERGRGQCLTCPLGSLESPSETRSLQMNGYFRIIIRVVSEGV